jgi:hypothetical protein
LGRGVIVVVVLREGGEAVDGRRVRLGNLGCRDADHRRRGDGSRLGALSMEAAPLQGVVKGGSGSSSVTTLAGGDGGSGAQGRGATGGRSRRTTVPERPEGARRVGRERTVSVLDADPIADVVFLLHGSPKGSGDMRRKGRAVKQLSEIVRI